MGRASESDGLRKFRFEQVQQYGCSGVAVTVRLLDVLTRIGPHLVRENDRTVLLGYARTVRDDGLAACANDRDKRDIDGIFAGAEESLAG